MKKFLLTLFVTMLTCIGAWAQGKVTLSPDPSGTIELDVVDDSEGKSFTVFGPVAEESPYGSNITILCDGQPNSEYVTCSCAGACDGTFGKNVLKMTLKPSTVTTGSVKIQIKVANNNNSEQYDLSDDIDLIITDKQRASNLEAIADQTVALGYTTKVPVSFAPNTAVLTVTSSNSNILASPVVDGVITLSTTDGATVDETSIITITPKAGSSAEAVSFTATIVAPVGIESISLAPATKTVMLGEKVTLIPTFVSKEPGKEPASKHLTWTSSDDEKATVDENGVVTTKAIGAVTITATSESINGADPVVATATITIKKELPVSDVKPKTIFKVGEEYDTELIVDPSLGYTIGTDYTVQYVAENEPFKTVLTIDEGTGHLVAMHPGNAKISATITPIGAAAELYTVFYREMNVIVEKGEYTFELANIEAITQGVGGTVTPVVSKIYRNGVEVTDKTLDEIVNTTTISLVHTYAGVTVADGSVSVATTAACGVVNITAEFLLEEAPLYNTSNAYAQINIVPSAEDRKGIKVTKTTDGIIRITSDYAGAYGTIENGTEWTYSITPTIDLEACEGFAEGFSATDVVDAIKAASKVELYGQINNSDMQIFSNWVGGNASKSNLIDLNMGEATMTEAITSNTNGATIADVSFIIPVLRGSDANQLTNLKRLELPEPAAGQTILPANFSHWFGNNKSVLEWLLISNGWTEIGASAFEGISALSTVIMNDDIITYRQHCFEGIGISTLIFPSTVKLIESYAFDAIENLQDVYFTSVDAPKVERNAWGVNSYQGWGGTKVNSDHAHYYDPSQPLLPWDVEYNKENVLNQTRNRAAYEHSTNADGPSGYMTILHIRPDANIASFTDPTRHYAYSYDPAYPPYEPLPGKETTALPDADGMKDYLFKDEGTTFFGRAAGYADEIHGYNYVWPSQMQWNRAYCCAGNNVLWDGVTPIDPRYDDSKELYRFVLIAFDAPVSPDPHFDKYEDNLWWSICVPYNFTAAEVRKVFGKDTQVCKLEKVVRNAQDDPETGVEKGVHLYFTDEQIRGRNDVADNDIVMEADQPYMIHPSKGDGAAPTKILENVVIPAGNYPKKFFMTSNAEGDSHLVYTFVGNYDAKARNEENSSTGIQYLPIPAHSYYLKDFGNSKHAFAYQPNEGKGSWTLNSCVVLAPADDDDFIDVFTGNKAKMASIFGVDDAVNAIENVEIICGSHTKYAPAGRYNIAGQKVGADYKGFIIKNGKKYLVK